MYTVLIDESGDSGVRNVQRDPSSGPGQYFTLCAAIFEDKNRTLIEDRLDGLFDNRTNPHAKRLSHFDKLHLCREICNLPVGLVGAVSNKLSLLNYLPEAEKTNTHFYNKVMQYLLERVGDILRSVKIPKHQVKIRLERREQSYSSLISFVKAIQDNPLDHRAMLLRNIDRFSISSVAKADDHCFRVPDMGAHALFTAFRRDSRIHSIVEPRYIAELGPKWLANSSGFIVPRGIKLIQSMGDLDIEPETKSTLEAFKNPDKRFWLL